MIARPLFVVAPARSGTTMTGRILARHHEVVYVHEIKYIWRYSRPWARYDTREARELTPSVARYIRRKLAAYVERGDGTRLVEKTPSNCFRIPFIQALFPDALFLELVRDPRDATLSAMKKWSSPQEPGIARRRMSNRVVPARDALFYLPFFVRQTLGRRLFPGALHVWGPRFPGIYDYIRTRSLPEICALQWRESFFSLRRGLESVPAERRLIVRFEDLLEDPAAELGRVLAFAGLKTDEEMLDFACGYVDPGARDRWRGRPDEMELMAPILADAIDELGYV